MSIFASQEVGPPKFKSGNESGCSLICPGGESFNLNLPSGPMANKVLPS